MNKVKSLWYFTIIIMCLVCFSGCREKAKAKVYNDSAKENTETSNEEKTNESSEFSESKNSDLEEYIYVQLSGAVNVPGVYKVQQGRRVFEVIEEAGGVKEEADMDAVNLARPVSDEMQIYVPTKEEVENSNGDYFWEYTNDATKIESEQTEDSLININTAAKEQLMELPGIGESKADAIINYREDNGGFKDISEVMNISGIKEAAFEKIKDLIKV